jgi:hypothetical protein
MYLDSDDDINDCGWFKGCSSVDGFCSYAKD